MFNSFSLVAVVAVRVVSSSRFVCFVVSPDCAVQNLEGSFFRLSWFKLKFTLKPNNKTVIILMNSEPLCRFSSWQWMAIYDSKVSYVKQKKYLMHILYDRLAIYSMPVLPSIRRNGATLLTVSLVGIRMHGSSPSFRWSGRIALELWADSLLS